MGDDDADPDDPADETITYQFEMPERVWRDWANSIPRGVTLADRIAELIAEDAAARRSGGYDEIEERTARLLGSRVYHRSRTAAQALDDENIEKVADELAEIQTIASMFDE